MASCHPFRQNQPDQSFRTAV